MQQASIDASNAQGGVQGIEKKPAPIEKGADDALQAVRHFLANLRKRWKLVLAIVIGCLLIGLIATMRSVPVYQAGVMIKIERAGTDVLNFKNADPYDWVNEQRAVNTQIELIRSRDMASRVVKDLNLLAGNSFFEQMRVQGPIPEGNSVRVRKARENLAVGLLRSNLVLIPKEETKIVFIGFESPEPGLSAKVANAYGRATIQSELDRGFGTTAFARDFLESRLEQAKAKLENSEREVIAYARRSGLVDVSAATVPEDSEGQRAGFPSLGLANLVAVNTAYSAARVKRIEEEAKWRQAASGSGSVQAEMLQNVAVQSLMSSRAELSAQYQSMLDTRTAEHPEMVQLASRIRELDRSMNAEIGKYRSAVRAGFELAARQEKVLQTELSGLKASSLNEQDSNVELGLLKREVETNRAFYDALLQRFKEISATSGSYASAISIVDPAQPSPFPIRPNPVMNMAIALALGLLLALLTVFTLGLLDDVIRLPDQLQERIGLATIGTVPKDGKSLDLQEHILNARSAIAEAYMSVITALGFTSGQGCPSPLLVTSSRPAEGKSTTAISIAFSFARSGKKVLLIDGDLRQPSIHRILGCEQTPGFSEVLSSQKSLFEVVKRPLEHNVDVIASGSLPPDPAGLLAGPRMAHVLEDARKIYDVIVVDSPPVMGIADAGQMSSACEATLFVIESGGARSNQIRLAVNRMKMAGANIIGAVLTKFDPKSEGYGSGYGYAYEYKYGSKH